MNLLHVTLYASCILILLFFQEEEIEALAAIYGDEWVAIDSELRKYHIKISDEKSQNIILMEVGKKKKGLHFGFCVECCCYISNFKLTTK